MRTKKLSNARKKNWADTVEAKKRNKANQKFLAFKKEEVSHHNSLHILTIFSK